MTAQKGVFPGSLFFFLRFPTDGFVLADKSTILNCFFGTPEFALVKLLQKPLPPGHNFDPAKMAEK